MKRIFLSIATLFSVVFFSSCVEQSAKYKELQAQLDSLQGNYGTQKNQLDEIFAALNEIERGLTSIRESEQILSVEATRENVPENRKEHIQSDISAIQSAIEQYKAKIDELKKDSNIKSIQFKKRLNTLRQELEEKSEIISRLSDQLAEKEQIIKAKDEKIETLDKAVADLQQNIENLNTEGEEMKNTISSQDKQIYSAYYIVGTKDELIKVGVLTRGGLFKSSKLSYQAEKKAFIKIDYREVSTINTNSSKAKVISIHPKGTYAVEQVNGESVLTISDPESFWEQTKYLVIQVQ